MVGKSMVDSGILPGDTLIFERASARDGDVVLAAVGDDTLTVKRLRKRARRVTLEPANPLFAPVTFASGDVRILGVLVRLEREFG